MTNHDHSERELDAWRASADARARRRMAEGPYPERRYLDEPEQAAYEAGWWQMFDHDSLTFAQQFLGLDGEALAAALDGAADALVQRAEQARKTAQLAEQQLAGVRFAAEPEGRGELEGAPPA